MACGATIAGRDKLHDSCRRRGWQKGVRIKRASRRWAEEQRARWTREACCDAGVLQ